MCACWRFCVCRAGTLCELTGNAFFADSAAKQPPPGTKGPARPRTGIQPRVFHPLCARRARRAAVCEHTHAARGKCAENGTKGTCLGQKAGRGGRFLGSGAPGGSGQRSRGRLAVAAARHALFRARRDRQRRLCVFHSFTDSILPPVTESSPASRQFTIGARQKDALEFLNEQAEPWPLQRSSTIRWRRRCRARSHLRCRRWAR